MSSTQTGERRSGPSGPKHLCQRCRDHNVCFECYRSERERRRARALAEIEAPRPLRSPFAVASVLSDREISHRRAMLACLQQQPGR
jgi:hypothetical protein